jgi:hypothetical protein
MPTEGSEWRALTCPVTGARTTATRMRRQVARVRVDRGVSCQSLVRTHRKRFWLRLQKYMLPELSILKYPIAGSRNRILGRFS